MARARHRSFTVVPTRRFLRLVRDNQSDPIESDHHLQGIIAMWGSLTPHQRQLLWNFSGHSPEFGPLGWANDAALESLRSERFLLFVRRISEQPA